MKYLAAVEKIKSFEFSAQLGFDIHLGAEHHEAFAGLYLNTDFVNGANRFAAVRDECLACCFDR